MNQPTPSEVIALRERYQRERGIGITQAQRELAALAYLKLRAWQNYENGREIQLGLWELINAKMEHPEIFGLPEKTAAEAAERA